MMITCKARGCLWKGFRHYYTYLDCTQTQRRLFIVCYI